MTKRAEVFPPGEFLKDELEARNWSQVEFAEIIGRPVRLVNEIIAGKKSITPETAVQLSASLGTSAELWLNLESQYQLSKVPSVDTSIEKKAKLYTMFPVRELIRRQWIRPAESIMQLERELLAFYCLSSLEETPTFAHAAKKPVYESISILQFSWLFRVKQIAQSQVSRKYSRAALIEAIPQLHALLSAPEEIRRVARILGDAGVRFVLVEALPGSKIDGACLWLSKDQPVVALSGRLDRIDNFWFVLRHELEHLLQEHGREAYVKLDEDLSESESANDEAVANMAASEFVVPEAELKGYMARVNPYFFAEDRVLGFAGRIGVHPGIVVGRLQKRLEKANYPNPYKFLRHHLVKVRDFISQSTPTDGWGNAYPTSHEG